MVESHMVESQLTALTAFANDHGFRAWECVGDGVWRRNDGATVRVCGAWEKIASALSAYDRQFPMVAYDLADGFSCDYSSVLA